MSKNYPKVSLYVAHSETSKSHAYPAWGTTTNQNHVFADAGGKHLSAEELRKRLGEMGFEVPTGLSVEDVADMLSDMRDKRVFRGNTYNDSWFGPTVAYTSIQEDRDPYQPEILIAMMHKGGDARGNYGHYEAWYFENAVDAFMNWRLSIEIEVKKGKYISFDGDDTEGAHFICNSDNTGTFESGNSYRAETIAEKLGITFTDLMGY